MSALLSFNNVHMRLGGRLVIEDVCLSVARGEIAALIGANGAGKSTLLRAGMGLAAVDGGTVRLGEEDPRAITPEGRARRASYLPQNPLSAWPITVEALTGLGRFAYGASSDRLTESDRGAINRALAMTALTDLRHRPIDTLSGGERARAHLARALAQTAPLLVLDEPTAGLDPAHVLAVLDAIRGHAQSGGAVLLTTHDVAFAARAANTVHVIAKGTIIAAGAPADALSPALLGQAYGRAAKLGAIDGVPAAVFF